MPQQPISRKFTNPKIGVLKYSMLHPTGFMVENCYDIQVNGKRVPGRPKMTWKQLTESILNLFLNIINKSLPEVSVEEYMSRD